MISICNFAKARVLVWLTVVALAATSSLSSSSAFGQEFSKPLDPPVAGDFDELIKLIEETVSADVWEHYDGDLALSSFSISTVTGPHVPLTYEEVERKVNAHLGSGEFNQAIDLVGQMPAGRDSDRLKSRIADAQYFNGAPIGAMRTASLIDDAESRHGAFSDFLGNQNEGPAGNQGGITEDDFEDLMDLIQETIFPDSWEDNGGTGRMQPFPSGVYVDSEGVLNKIEAKELKKWNQIKRKVGSNANWQLDSSAELRKISLNRLELELMRNVASGNKVSDELKYLGGIYDLQYVMVYPESGDVVIAGPAGPWEIDDEGRAVNVETGRPVLLLDDLVVCLRNAWEGNGTFGCSIEPRGANLVAVKDFLDTTKLKGNAWSEELRDLMGQQDITVHGIDARTHAGQVIVEADYRMKLLGMGLEETITEVPSYLDRVKIGDDGSVPPMDVVRWWFTMNYDGIVASPEGDIFELKGQAVKVLSESEFLNDQGERVHTGKSSEPTGAFARDFTKHFPKLTAKYSIYGELENVFDLSLAANLIKQKRLAEKAGWTPTYFTTKNADRNFIYNVALEETPKTVDTIMNEKTVRQKVGSKRLVHRILGVSGGVEFDANRYTRAVKVDDSIETVKSQLKTESWNWD